MCDNTENEEMIVTVNQFMQLRKEAWKNSGLQRGLKPWPRYIGAMLYQLSYEATDIGSRSIVGSYVPVKEMSVNDIWNKSYELQKWNEKNDSTVKHKEKKNKG